MDNAASMAQGIMPPPGAAFFSNVNFIPPGLEDLYKEPFSYNIVFNNLATNVSQTGTANINNDSYFVCTIQTADIWDAATGNTTNTNPAVAPMLFQTKDSSSGKFGMDQLTPLSAQFGTAEQPKVWLYRARLYLPGGQIQCELVSRMTATQTVRLTFEGFKVYKVPDELPRM